jgi:uncharacterized membrane protein (DUF373 family)
MEKNKSADNFPIDVDSPLIHFLQKIILLSIKVLALLMSIVIIWSVVDVGINLYQKIFNPPFLLINFEDILNVFGGFLIVLIAIEIFLNIILYLRKDVSHLKLVIATALMAIARKVIILDYDHLNPLHLFGIGTVIFALGGVYWLIRKPLGGHDYQEEDKEERTL